MPTYADTSFLVPAYSPEEDSLMVLKWLQRAREALPFTPIHRLELRTALRLRVFRGEITPEQRKQSFHEIDSDMNNGVLTHVAVSWTDAFREAEALAATHVEELGVRSMDLLHVALARTLGAKRFLTLDSKQKLFANVAGLKVAF